MPRGEASDPFDRVRSIAASFLFAAGVAAIAGSFLEWVTIDPPPRLPVDQNADPFTGTAAGDGWWVVGAGVVVIASAALLVIKQTATWAWVAFAAWIVAGAIAVADYRGVDELTERMNRVAEDVDPAFGLMLVAAASLIGVIASIAGVAATPRR